jgi:DMSO/TMAO reductase YedYZ heme-binding membrane subunit
VRRWNLAQRLAVLVAIGVVLHVSSQVVLFEEPMTGGWFGYAPESEAVHVPGGRGARFSPLVQLLVITAHVAVWAVAAVWILADRNDGNDD